ncbi:type ISP restriction/modification enzyme [Micromonospora sp. NPDC050200]|uniref:type ISP restriction/modification enzyme n=1 Tax=Micromonospora sp. NPDC050200 TaxID=3155664 RepID=UPI003400EBAB
MVRMSDGSAGQVPCEVAQAVSRFGRSVAPLLRARVGQAEANISVAVEVLLRDMAKILKLELLAHREASDKALGIRPDLAIDVAGARVGVVELKAPGKGVPGGTRWGDSRDRAQWERLRNLPNVLYTDGSKWAVYHYGVQAGETATLDGDLARSGSRLRPAGSIFTAVIRDFLYWKPTPPRSLRDLIKVSAGLCQLLRDEVKQELARESVGATKPLFSEHLADWQEWLFPDLTEDEFVDAYAQTITFGLLLARREGVIFEGLEIPDIGEKLAKRHLLVGRALSILTARQDRGQSIEERSIVLQTMRRVIGAADWAKWPAAGTYHWLYEEFLDTYDSRIRRQMGAYYTPTAVSDFMARFVDEVLQMELGVRRGLADDTVVVLDPAMGTGTFLQSVLDRVAETVTAERGDVPASLRELLPRLIGFERQIGPFAVAELKLDQALEAHQSQAKDEDFRLFVADTLDDPYKAPLPVRARLYAPLAKSRQDANTVKVDRDVTVVIGNPPYRTRAKAFGKWVLAANRGQRPLLYDFRVPGNGRFDHKLHDMAVYFWRWALWKAFESTPEQPAGVVAFITTHGYLNGPGFAGMRQYLRRHADRGWIIDLSTEGHQAHTQTRVFPGVQHPVCIGIFARRSMPDPEAPAIIQYLAIPGTRAEKFAGLDSVRLTDSRWRDCPSGWTSSFRPIQPGSWTQFPSIDDLLPHTSLGVKCNRNWVHCPDPDVLARRWHRLIDADAAEKRVLMKETVDRTVDRAMPSLPGEPTSLPLGEETSTNPRIGRTGFRSFDRQYLIFDQRVVDRPRPDLWRIAGPQQVFAVTQLREALTNGPAVVFSAYLPDSDHYKGSHGGRVIPLYRSGGSAANVAPGLTMVLRRRLECEVADQDVMAYIAALLAHPGYTRRFFAELRQPGVRVPLTANPSLWQEAVALGSRVIWLHTYGERFADDRAGRPLGQPMSHRPGVIGSVAGGLDDMPAEIEYLDGADALTLGGARIAPVSRAAATYEVSGMKVVKHWFDYRKRDPAGRRGGSPLEEINAERWTRSMTEELRDLIAVLEGCVGLESQQADLLDRIVTGPVITVDDLEDEAVLPVPADARRIVDGTGDLTLF